MLCGEAGASSRADGAAESKSVLLPNPCSQAALGKQLDSVPTIGELTVALEIERRFLVVGYGWRPLVGPPQALRQGYVVSSADGVTVRVRLNGAGQAWLTLKAAADACGLVRHEFEYPIPEEDAEGLWQLAPDRLEKTRFHLDLPGGEWVVDCFEGDNAPLVLAEVELPAVDADLSIPAWCGLEVTGDSRWSSALLAAKPIQSWTAADRCRYGLA